MAVDVSVIVPNFNGVAVLPTCLESLARQSLTPDEILVIDGASTDGSPEWVARAFPQVQIIQLQHNSGFGIAVNEGIRQSTREFITLLNNDVEVHPYWVEELRKSMDAHTEIGFCASKMLDFYDRTCIDSAGIEFTTYGVGYPRGHREQDVGQYDALQEVFGACGGAAMYRRAMFDSIGLFDEDFYAYYEDVDLSFRAQLSGYQCLYVPSAIVYHRGGETMMKKTPHFGIHLTTRNLWFTVLKNMPLVLLVKYMPKLSYTFVRGFAAWALKGHSAAYLMGLLSVAMGAHRMFKKRVDIQASRKISIADLERLIVNRFPSD